jgi:hypothetical protein
MTQMNYSVDKTVVIVGVAPVVGFAGDRVKVTFNQDLIETVMGTDGNGRHVVSKDKSGTVSITLEHGSPSNATFELLRMAGEPFPIIVKDNSSLATMFMTADAMIKKQPDMGLGAKPSDLEWAFSFISGDMMYSPSKEY